MKNGKVTAVAVSQEARAISAELPHNRYHRAAKSSAAMAIVYAAMSGRELLEWKRKVGHGAWENWLKTNCEFSQMTAWRYMELAKKLKTELANLSLMKDLPEGDAGKSEHAALLQLLDKPPSELLPEDTEKLLERLRHATKGQTLQQLYLDFGLTTAQPKLGGARDQTPAALPAGETMAHRTAYEFWSKLMLQLHDEMTKYKSYIHLDSAELNQIYLSLLDVRNNIADAIKDSKGMKNATAPHPTKESAITE